MSKVESTRIVKNIFQQGEESQILRRGPLVSVNFKKCDDGS